MKLKRPLLLQQQREFKRTILEEDVADFSNIKPDQWRSIEVRYKRLTKDSGAKFPTAKQRREEDWRDWREAVETQIDHASTAQVDAYFAQAYPRGLPHMPR